MRCFFQQGRAKGLQHPTLGMAVHPVVAAAAAAAAGRCRQCTTDIYRTVRLLHRRRLLVGTAGQKEGRRSINRCKGRLLAGVLHPRASGAAAPPACFALRPPWRRHRRFGGGEKHRLRRA